MAWSPGPDQEPRRKNHLPAITLPSSQMHFTGWTRHSLKTNRKTETPAP